MTVQLAARPDIAVGARDLCKAFTIHTAPATSLKEIVVRGVNTYRQTTVYEALKDVSFELKRGRSLAVAGSNGSGKSTLLKLISGISQPTSGLLEVQGRVAALLELGAGFHPELTGMENIFLQGAILGLSREQIMDRLDAILHFCELGDFIHTPMKRYSSGMTIRLGFALAVFSDADLLLIDEVLAVGDIAFQTKCIRKIHELRDSGKTILFVSHFVQHIETLADDLLWLEKGNVLAFGPVDDVLPGYLHALAGGSAAEKRPLDIIESGMDMQDPRHQLLMASNPQGMRMKPQGAMLEEVKFLGADGQPRQLFVPGEPMIAEITFVINEELPNIDVVLGYASSDGTRIGWHFARGQGLTITPTRGRHKLRMTMSDLPFHPGRYRISVGLQKSLRTFDIYDLHHEAYMIQVRGKADDDISTTRPAGRFLSVKTVK